MVRLHAFLQFVLNFLRDVNGKTWTELLQIAALGLGAFAISFWSLPAALLVVAIVVICALEMR